MSSLFIRFISAFTYMYMLSISGLYFPNLFYFLKNNIWISLWVYLQNICRFLPPVYMSSNYICAYALFPVRFNAVSTWTYMINTDVIVQSHWGFYLARDSDEGFISNQVPAYTSHCSSQKSPTKLIGWTRRIWQANFCVSAVLQYPSFIGFLEGQSSRNSS